MEQFLIEGVKRIYGQNWRVYGPYEDSDKRLRIVLYDGKVRKTRQYAKLLIEVKLGRMLQKGEEVDHKDNNPLNNNYDNLQVLSLADNRRKQAMDIYGDKIRVCCGFCNKELFVRKSDFMGKKKFCSNSCRSKFYGNQYCKKPE